jgi:hypothetical protein
LFFGYQVGKREAESDFWTVNSWLESPEPTIRCVRQFLLDMFFMNPASVEEDLGRQHGLRDLRARELVDRL